MPKRYRCAVGAPIGEFFVVLALCCCVPLQLAKAAATCKPPPQGWGPTWWSQYKSWCKSCGGRICDVYNLCQGRCELPSTGAASSGSPSNDPAVAIGTAMGNVVGDMVACKLLGQCPPGMQPPPDNVSARRDLYQATEEQKALLAKSNKQEEERQAAAHQRVLRALSQGSGGLQARNLDDDKDLQVGVMSGPLQSREVRPISVQRGKDGTYVTAGLSPVQRLTCASALIRDAQDFSRPYDFPARRNMSRDAANYLTGVPARAPCPTDRSGLPPAPEEPRAVALKTKEMLLLSRFYERASDDRAKLAVIEAELAKDQKRRAEAAKAKDAAEQKVQEARKKAATKRPPSSADAKDPNEDDLLKEALASLDESTSTLQTIDKETATKRGKREEVLKDLKNVSGMYEDATRNPDKTDDILAKLAEKR